jgi:hypothetical protein
MGLVRNVCKVLVRKPEGERPLGRPRHRWESNVEMDLKEILWVGKGWIYLAQHMDKLQAFLIP